MEGLRDHYTTKITRFRNYRLPFSTYREQYWQQASRVRDYSSAQMERLHENYAKNMGRLRTYSVVQLERFRLQYQLQHKHMAKILEAMNFNIDSCRTGPGTDAAGIHDVDPNHLNLELSLAQLQMNSGINDVDYNESDSITIGPNGNALIIQADCIQENGRHEDDRFDQDLDYVTPPGGGGTPVAAESSTLKTTATVEDSAASPDAEQLTNRLLAEIERVNDLEVLERAPTTQGDSAVWFWLICRIRVLWVFFSGWKTNSFHILPRIFFLSFQLIPIDTVLLTFFRSFIIALMCGCLLLPLPCLFWCHRTALVTLMGGRINL